MRKNFIRKKENFTCDNCGKFVKGNGYTDHCPECLYGKHVDEEIPGDRNSSCKGLMKPTGLVKKGGKTKIEYRCESCGKNFTCKTSSGDNTDQIIRIGSRQ
jgi:ribosomal protein L37AE/L43A